jgi:hypothetical protein
VLQHDWTRTTTFSIIMPIPGVKARTWRFDVNVQVGPLSNQDEIYDLFRGILNESKAITEISGLEQSSFSCDLLEDGRARISLAAAAEILPVAAALPARHSPTRAQIPCF